MSGDDSAQSHTANSAQVGSGVGNRQHFRILQRRCPVTPQFMYSREYDALDNWHQDRNVL